MFLSAQFLATMPDAAAGLPQLMHQLQRQQAQGFHFFAFLLYCSIVHVAKRIS